MSDHIVSQTDRAGTPGGLPSLTDRVQARLVQSTRSMDRRAGASRPRLRQRKVDGSVSPAGQTPADPALREAKALRRVYHDLGEAHRLYRRRTGESVSPALRAAVDGFKRAPSLASLVMVAAFIDELGLLSW